MYRPIYIRHIVPQALWRLVTNLAAVKQALCAGR